MPFISHVICGAGCAFDVVQLATKFSPAVNKRLLKVILGGPVWWTVKIFRRSSLHNNQSIGTKTYLGMKHFDARLAGKRKARAMQNTHRLRAPVQRSILLWILVCQWKLRSSSFHLRQNPIFPGGPFCRPSSSTIFVYVIYEISLLDSS